MKRPKSRWHSLDSLKQVLLHNWGRKQTIALYFYIYLVNVAASSPCPVGFMPPDCIHQCKDGFYGANCLSPCSGSCANQSCRADTGECYRCRVGFVGTKCSQKCSRGAHGQDCKMTCPLNCLDNDCDPFTGYCNQCLEGFSGSTCDDIETEDDRIAQGKAAKRHNTRRDVASKPISGNTVLYIVIVIVSFSVPICAIACWWWFLKKKMKDISSTDKQTQPIYRPPGMATVQARKVSRSHKQKRDDSFRNVHKNASDLGDGDIQSGISHGKGEHFNRDSPTKNSRRKLTNKEYYSVESDDQLERLSKMDRECRVATEQISPDKDCTQNMDEMSKIIEENRPLELQRAANYSQNLFFKTRLVGLASEQTGQGRQPLDKAVQSFGSTRDVHGHNRPESRTKSDTRRGFRNDNHADDAEDMGSVQYNNHVRKQKDLFTVSGKSEGFKEQLGRLWQKLKRASTRRHESPPVPAAILSSKSLMVDLDRHNSEDMRLVTRDTMTSADCGKWTEGTLTDVHTQSKALNISLRDHREAVYNQTTEPLHREKAGKMTKVQDVAKLLGLGNKLKSYNFKGQMHSPERVDEFQHSGHNSRFPAYESHDQSKSDPDETSIVAISPHFLRLINAKASEIFSRQVAGHTARRRHRPNGCIRREHSCPDVSLVTNEAIGQAYKPPTSAPGIATLQTYDRGKWGGMPSPQSLMYHGAERGPQDATAVLPQNKSQSIKYLENSDAARRINYPATASEKLFSCFHNNKSSLQSCAKIDVSYSRPGQQFAPQNYRLFPTIEYPPDSMTSMQQIVLVDSTELSSVYGSRPPLSPCNTPCMSSFGGQGGIWRDACQRTAPAWNQITLLNPAAALHQRKSAEQHEPSSCERSPSDHQDVSQLDCSHSYDVEKCETTVKYCRNPHSKPETKVAGNRPPNDSPQSKVKAKYQIVNETGPSHRNKSPRYADRVRDMSNEANTYSDRQQSIHTRDNALMACHNQKTELNQRQDRGVSCFKTDAQNGDNFGDLAVHNTNRGEMSSVCDKAVDTDVCLQVHYYLKDLLQLSARSAPCTSFHIPCDAGSPARFTDTECTVHAGDRFRYELGNIVGLSRNPTYADSLYRYQRPGAFTTEIGTQIGTEPSHHKRELINRAAGPDDEDARRENKLKSRPGPQSFDISTQVYCTKPMKYSFKKSGGKVKDGRGGHEQTKHGKPASVRKKTQYPEPLMVSKACYVRTGRATSHDRFKPHQPSTGKQTKFKDSTKKKKPIYRSASFSESNNNTDQLTSGETKHHEIAKNVITTTSPPRRSRTHEKSTNQSASNCLSAPMSSTSDHGEGSDFKGSMKIQPIKIIRVRVEPETDRNMEDFEHLEKVTYTENAVAGNSTNSSNERASSDSESSEFFSSWKTLSVKQKEKLQTANPINTMRGPNHWAATDRHVNQMDGQITRNLTIINETSQMGEASLQHVHTENINPGKMADYAEDTSEGHVTVTGGDFRSDFWRGRNPAPCSNFDNRTFWNRRNVRMDLRIEESPKHRFYRSDPGRSAVASGMVTSPVPTTTSNKSPTNSHMGRNLPMRPNSPGSRDSFTTPRSRFLSTRALHVPSESLEGSRMISEYPRTQYPSIAGQHSAKARSSMFTRHANPEYNLTISSFKDVYEPNNLGASGSMFTDSQDKWGSLNDKKSPGTKKARFWERKIETSKYLSNFKSDKIPLSTSRDRAQLYSEDDSSWSTEAKEECEENDDHSDEESSDGTVSSRSKSTSTDIKRIETTTQKETHTFSTQPRVPVKIEAKFPRFSYTAKPLPRGLVGASKCNKGNFSPQMDYRRGLNNFHYILKSPKSLRTPQGSPEAVQGNWDTPMRNWRRVSNHVDYPVPSLLEDAVELNQGRMANDANAEKNDKEETTEETKGTRTLRSPYSSEDFREQYNKLVHDRESHKHDLAGSRMDAEDLVGGRPGSDVAKDVSESGPGIARMNDVVRVLIDSETEYSVMSRRNNSEYAVAGRDYSLPAVGKLDNLYYSTGKPEYMYSIPDDQQAANYEKLRHKSDYPVTDRPEASYSMTSVSHTGVSGRQDNTFPMMSKAEAAYHFPNKSEMSPPFTGKRDEIYRMPHKLGGGYPTRDTTEAANAMPKKPGNLFNAMTESEARYPVTDARQQNPTYHLTPESAGHGMDKAHSCYPMNHEVQAAYSEHGIPYVIRNKRDPGYPVVGVQRAPFPGFKEQGAVYPMGANQVSYPRVSGKGAVHPFVSAYGIPYPSFNEKGLEYPAGADEAHFPRVSEGGDVYSVGASFDDQWAVYPAAFNTGNPHTIQSKLDAELEFSSYPRPKPKPGYHLQNNIEFHPLTMIKSSDALNPTTEENWAAYHMQTKLGDAYISGGQKEDPDSHMSKKETSCHTKSDETRAHYLMIQQDTAAHEPEAGYPTMNNHYEERVLSMREAAHPTSLISEPVYTMAPMPDADFLGAQKLGASYPLSGKSKPADAAVVNQDDTYARKDVIGPPVRKRHETVNPQAGMPDFINSNSKGQFSPKQSSSAVSKVDKQPTGVPTLIFGVDKDTETASINFGVGNVTVEAAKPSLDFEVYGNGQESNNLPVFSQVIGCPYTLLNASSEKSKRPRSKRAPASATDAKREEEVTEFKSVIDEELFYDAMDAKEFVFLKNKKSLTDRTLGQSESSITKITEAANRKLKLSAKSATTAPSGAKTPARKKKKGKYAMRFAASESGESTSVSRKSSGIRLAGVFRLGRAEHKKRRGSADNSTPGETRNPSESGLSSDEAGRSKLGPCKTTEAPPRKKDTFFDTLQPVSHEGQMKSSLTQVRQTRATPNDIPDLRERVHFEHTKRHYSPSEIFYDAA